MWRALPADVSPMTLPPATQLAKRPPRAVGDFPPTDPRTLDPMLPGIEDHPHARAVLTPALPPDGNPNHAYLFHGPAGSGKREIARALAAALLSEGSPDPREAAARVQSGAHPDLTWVSPSGAAEMLVSDIDEPVVAAATRTPFESRRRVFVIERADTMNDQSANRMLKTLEEPPSFAHLILITDRLGEVLPTIASRCQAVRFDARPPAVIAERLATRNGVPPQTADACARLALGDADRALQLALGSGPALRDSAEKLARAAMRDELQHKPWSALLAQSKAAGEQAAAEVEGTMTSDLEVTAKRDRKRVEREGGERGKRAARRASTRQLDLSLQLTGLWLRDLACVADGVPEVVHNRDRLQQLAADAQGRDARRLREGVDVVDDTRMRLQLNVSEELALEALAYRLADLLA
jgi:DNA polymerase-3 subunit delta'